MSASDDRSGEGRGGLNRPRHGNLPLKGLFVVEIGHSLAGPFCGMILSDLGATVLKVESAGKGDHARDWGPPFHGDDAVLFHAVNRGKRSVTLDMKDAAQTAALRALILERADIVLQNLKVGSLDAVGLGGAELSAAKPSLIYCNLGAFGRVGPRREAPGYDPLIQAFSGMMAQLGNPDDAPSRVPVAINDIGTGIWGALGILAALVKRKDTGLGGLVDVSLFETALAWMTIPASDTLASGEPPPRLGSGVANIVPYQAWDLADGRLLIAAGNDLLFAKLCRVLCLDALADDPRFVTNGARVANRWELIPLLADAIRARQVGELTKALQQAGVPCGPVNTVDVALADAQTEALGMVQQLPGGPRTIALPLAFDGQRPPLSGPAPRLGEHQDMLAGKTP